MSGTMLFDLFYDKWCSVNRENFDSYVKSVNLMTQAAFILASRYTAEPKIQEYSNIKRFFLKRYSDGIDRLHLELREVPDGLLSDYAVGILGIQKTYDYFELPSSKLFSYNDYKDKIQSTIKILFHLFIYDVGIKWSMGDIRREAPPSQFTNKRQVKLDTFNSYLERLKDDLTYDSFVETAKLAIESENYEYGIKDKVLHFSTYGGAGGRFAGRYRHVEDIFLENNEKIVLITSQGRVEILLDDFDQDIVTKLVYHDESEIPFVRNAFPRISLHNTDGKGAIDKEDSYQLIFVKHDIEVKFIRRDLANVMSYLKEYVAVVDTRICCKISLIVVMKDEYKSKYDEGDNYDDEDDNDDY